MPNASRDTPASTGRHPLARRISEERRHPLRRLLDAQDPRVVDRLEVRAQRRHGGRDRGPWDPDHLGGEHLLLVEPLPARVVEPADGRGLEQQRAVDEAGVDIQEQVGVEPVVGRPVTGSTPLTLVWTSLMRSAAASASVLDPNVIVYVSTSVRCSRRHGFRS